MCAAAIFFSSQLHGCALLKDDVLQVCGRVDGLVLKPQELGDVNLKRSPSGMP
ncbi:hypothetical protein Hdeb2414_s0009g00323411 [Helianthus debilis subsp. tardiflorus]